MAKSPSERTIKNFLNKQASKYPFVEFRVLRASNGEVAILPVNPTTGEPEVANPRKFQVKELWNRCCDYDGIARDASFAVFSDGNPWKPNYESAMEALQRGN